jgi:hypothetical protein
MDSKMAQRHRQPCPPFASRTAPETGSILEIARSFSRGRDDDLPRLNENQLAERWGVSVRTLQAARIKGGGVPFIRIGRSVRYRLEDVLAYEQARLRTNTSETP